MTISETKKHYLQFSKFHGAGNDFIIIDACHGYPLFANFGISLEDFVRSLCNRHTGIGADGVIFLDVSKVADYKMVYYNADGSRAVCGNGARCICSYIKRRGLVQPSINDIHLETDYAVQSAHVAGGARNVRVDMGIPSIDGDSIPIARSGSCINYPIQVGEREIAITAVGIGNPHAVIFVDDVQTAEVCKIGQKLEMHDFFPRRTNVEFVQITSRDEIQVRVWERGVGETLACGTGACAAVIAGVILDRLDRKVSVNLTGGRVEITWDPKTERISLLGPTAEVFKGEIDLDRFFSDTTTSLSSL